MKNKREAAFVTALLTAAIVFVIEQMAINIHFSCIGVSHGIVDVKPGFCIKGMCFTIK